MRRKGRRSCEESSQEQTRIKRNKEIRNRGGFEVAKVADFPFERRTSFFFSFSLSYVELFNIKIEDDTHTHTYIQDHRLIDRETKIQCKGRALPLLSLLQSGARKQGRSPVYNSSSSPHDDASETRLSLIRAF